MVYLTVVTYPTVVQGVFINPAFIEPFGLTLIEVLFLELYIKKKNCDCLFFTQSSNFTLFFSFLGWLSRQQLMVCPLWPLRMEDLLIYIGYTLISHIYWLLETK